MHHARFLRTVLALWGDHWQKPCLAFLSSHGYPCTRQTLYNYKTKARQIPDCVAELLEAERKARNASLDP